MSATTDLADDLLRRFRHMATSDGGSLTVAAVDDATIRFRYHPGADPDCEGGECVLPGVELQAMLRETAARRAPGVDVHVEVA